MPPFQPIHFVPKQHQAQILAKPVLCILAVPHLTQCGRTNHWCFYLKTSTDTSVCIDCQPTHSIPSTALQGGSKANIIISELDYPLPPDAAAHFSLNVISGLRVEDVFNKFVEHERNKYEFDPQGVGCRFWIMDQINLLHQIGIIPDESEVSEANAALVKLWPEQTPLQIDKGAYYQ